MSIEDEWHAKQEFDGQVRVLQEAVDVARNAGVDVLEVMSRSLEGYETLTKLKARYPGDPATIARRVLIEQGIRNQCDAFVAALTNATIKMVK